MPIIDIKSIKPSDHPLYFCDAMVWIAALKIGKLTPENHEFPYIDFFNRIIEINALAYTGDKGISECKHIPKVIVTSLLLSEIINTYMRNVAMPLNFPGLNCKGLNFKSAYRDAPDSNYKRFFNILIDDLIGYYDSKSLVLYDDKFKASDPFGLIKTMKHSMDFNDFFYFQQFKKEKIPILTADKDFKYYDCDIIRSLSKPTFQKR